MANNADALIATMMQEWRIKSNNLDKIEWKKGMYGAMDFTLAQNNVAGSIVSQELQQAAHKSTGKTIKVPVWVADTNTVANGRSCTIPNHEVKDALVSLTWASFNDGFLVVPNRYLNNDVALQEHFNKNMEAMLMRWYTKINALCLANLESNKNTVASVNTMGYTEASGVISAYKGQRYDFMGDFSSIMHSNGYGGRMNVIGNAGVENVFMKLWEHGTYNDVNRAYEYNDKKLYIDSTLANAANQYATMYMVPDGMVGLLSRVSRAEGANTQQGAHAWGMDMLPGLGNLVFGTHTLKVEGNMADLMNHFAGDNSSVGDMTCDAGIYMGWSIDLAFVNAYNSRPTTVQGPILKAQIATAESAS